MEFVTPRVSDIYARHTPCRHETEFVSLADWKFLRHADSKPSLYPWSIRIFMRRRERGGNRGGWRGCNGRTEVDAKSMVPLVCQMQMPHSDMLYVRTCTTCIIRVQVVRQLIVLGVVVTNKIYPWSGLYLGRASVTRCTLLAHCTSRIMSGVNVQLATFPFLCVALLSARGENVRDSIY